MQIFDFDDYKEFIAAQIRLNAQVRGYRSLLAKAAGCQKSFFSQVTRRYVHLTPDHAAGLCTFWGLDDLESEYFLALVDLARAGTEKLKAIVHWRLGRLKAQKGRFGDRLKKAGLVEAKALGPYYSSWYWAAIHVATSVPGLQTPRAIGERLGLEHTLVVETLRKLEDMGLVKRTKERWQATERDIHLPKDSPLTEANHTHWRQRAVIDVQKKWEESFHYSSIFAISESDAGRFRDSVLKFVLDSRNLIEPSVEEEVFCFTADFFKV